ncbi:hypothetical protein ES703_83996 [subsurface metagenome]
MGGNDYSIVLEEDAPGAGLGGENIDSGAGHPLFLNRLRQRFFVDEPAAGGVDNPDGGLDRSQLFGPDHPLGRGGEGHMEGNEVRFLEQLLDGDELYLEVTGVFHGDKGVVADELHLQPVGALGHLGADVAQPQYAQRLVPDLGAHKIGALPLSPPEHGVRLGDVAG